MKLKLFRSSALEFCLVYELKFSYSTYKKKLILFFLKFNLP